MDSHVACSSAFRLRAPRLHDPEILLLDEPFSGLDLEASELLGEWLESFVAKRKTVLMATHDLEQGLQGARRWAFVDRRQDC